MAGLSIDMIFETLIIGTFGGVSCPNANWGGQTDPVQLTVSGHQINWHETRCGAEQSKQGSRSNRSTGLPKDHSNFDLDDA